jgi:uncharacterized protein (DUF427 family)
MRKFRRRKMRLERGHKRVRAYLGKELVLDTIQPTLVWEVPYYPAYYIPVGDIKAQLVPTGETESYPDRGDADLYDVHAGGRVAFAAATRYRKSPIEELRDLVRFNWDAMDQWFEEDEPVYVHPRDPYKRVDVLASSRHIEVVVNGVKVADSRQPRILFETGLPPRYYIPITDVRMDLLEPSGKKTRCPYKGTANYWTLDADGTRYEDFVWTYRVPTAESQKIAGLVAFYNEKVDIYLDGVLQDQPRTKFG